MAEAHARFEELAVGHVLGGLAQDDAAEFRGHLISCRECRLRVAELRDIASDLEAVQREERQRARTKTEVARREESDDDGSDVRSRPWTGPSRRAVTVGIVVLLMLTFTFAAWSFHLRTVNTQLLSTAQRQDVVMEAFAAGTIVATSFNGSTDGRVAISDDEVAVTLVDVPQPAAGRAMIIWLLTEDEHAPVFVSARAGQDGRVAWSGPRRDADRLLVTIQQWPPETQEPVPGGTVVAQADLTAPLVGSLPEGVRPRFDGIED